MLADGIHKDRWVDYEYKFQRYDYIYDQIKNMRVFFTFLFLSAILFSCTGQSTQPKSDIENFWIWFQNNKINFEHITEENRDAKLDSILNHLKPIKEGLAVEVSDKFDGKRDFVISANSDIDNFSAVEKIVKSAPVMKGWTITAFRQRAKEDFTLKYKDLKFKPSKMLFRPVTENGKLNIEVYVNGIKNHNYDTVAYYGIIAMDSVLGEYDSVTKVGTYTFHELRDVKNLQLKPVLELPAYIDSYYKK